MPQSKKTLVSGNAALLARRYADAFYELAEADKNLDTAAAELRLLRRVAEDSAEFIAIAGNPILTRAQLVKAAESVASILKLGKLSGKFLGLVARHRRLIILPAIIDAFLVRLETKRGEFTATVRTAAALTEPQKEQLAARLESIAGRKVHLDVAEDRGLIGGITVRLGSRLIDASVKNRLERLERRLKSEAA